MSQRSIARALGVSRDTIRRVRKNARAIEEAGSTRSIVIAEDTPNNCLEVDEVCLRRSPSFLVWLVVSRRVRQVLRFMFGS